MASSQTLPCNRFVQDFDTHNSKHLPSQSIFRQVRVAIADLMVEHIVRVRKDLEVPLVRRKLRRPVNICECQAWDPKVSKFRVGHVPEPRNTYLTASVHPSLKDPPNHHWRSEGIGNNCVVTQRKVGCSQA
jgi:hypothetical protein